MAVLPAVPAAIAAPASIVPVAAAAGYVLKKEAAPSFLSHQPPVPNTTKKAALEASARPSLKKERGAAECRGAMVIAGSMVGEDGNPYVVNKNLMSI